jgi:hypothetical protein
VVVNDFNVGRTSVCPSKANPKLIIDADAVLPLPVRLQRLEPIAGWDPEVLQDVGLVQLVQSTPGSSPEVRRTDLGSRLGPCGVEDVLGASVAERLDHGIL